MVLYSLCNGVLMKIYNHQCFMGIVVILDVWINLTINQIHEAKYRVLLNLGTR